MKRIETIRENLTDLTLKNAADEICEDLYSLNDNESWFYPEFMARHSVFAKALCCLLQQSEEMHCCGSSQHKGTISYTRREAAHAATDETGERNHPAHK